MALLALFNGIPLLYRALAILALVAGLVGYGFHKGYSMAEGQEKAKAASDMAAYISQAKAQSVKDKAAELQAIQDRDEAAARADTLTKSLAEALLAKPQYRACKIDDDIKAKLNAALKGDAP